MTSDDGAHWASIADDVSGSRYSWTVPNVPTGAARMQVSVFDEIGLLGIDSSNAPFTIGAPITDAPSLGSGAGLVLFPATPNPFRDGVHVAFELAMDSEVRLTVFDAAGRCVRELVQGLVRAGRHEARWDGRDAAGRGWPMGVYYLRLQAGGATAFERAVLIE